MTTGPRQPNPMQTFVNAVLRRLLRSPLHGVLSRKILLTEVVGRRSGKRYVVPMANGEHAGHVLMGAAKARWLQNLIPDRTVTLTLRGRRREMYPELLTDEDSVVELYPHIVKDRAHARFQQLRVDPTGAVNRDDIRTAITRGLTVPRLRPA